MPTESAPPAAPAPQPSFPPQPSSIKCSLCGAGALASTAARSNEGIVLLREPIERICGSCVRAQETRDALRNVLSGTATGLGLHGITHPREYRSEVDGNGERDRVRDREREDEVCSPQSDVSQFESLEREGGFPFPKPMPINSISSPRNALSQSLPTQHARPWSTAPRPEPIPESRENTPSPVPSLSKREGEDIVANPLLDVTKARIPSVGRGPLYPGSIFKGTQTSGRSAYEVEVKLLDVNFAESTLSGYLSISHLTDSHPHLTTFFTGEIIGPKFGFITGQRFGASEHDDMRHWGRFEQFRRPSTRLDMVRPEMFFRDPQPDRSKGETRVKERDFVFLRIKERFLVPDHTVRDISGASFAGFYFAMVDLAPTGSPDPPLTPLSPTTPKSPLPPTSPTIPRRMSSNADARSPTREMRMPRRQSSSRADREGPREATIRGYYFHSLNQEPFQELFLTHVPNRSCSTMELR